MQEEHQDYISPDLCQNSYNSFWNHGKGDMKVFFSRFPLLCSHQPMPYTPTLDYHRSSFLFCFSSRVPIQSIFIPPSVPFTAAFISTRSLNPWQLLFSVTPLSLFTSALTSSFSLPPPVCHPSPASFNLTCLIFPSTAPFPDFFFLPFSAQTHFHSVKCTVSPSSLSKALHGPIKFPSLMSFIALHTWSRMDSTQVQGQTDPDMDKSDLITWPRRTLHFFP